VRDEDPLEGQVEHRAQGRQRPALEDRRPPDPEQAAGRRWSGHPVREDDGPLLGQVERSLQTAATVGEGHETAGQGLVGEDGIRLGPGRIALPEQPRTMGGDAVPVGELVEVPDVIRLDDHDPGRLRRFEPAIDLRAGDRRRGERIDEDDLGA
jgi:hypothetical protein